MRPLSTIVNSRHLSFAGFWCIAALAGTLRAGECTPGKGLTSNNIRWLVGSGDTLWMITEKDARPALNMIAGEGALADPTKENNWWSYSLGCKKGGLYDLALGGGWAVASLDTAPNIIWTFNHAGSRIKEFSLPWQRDTTRDFTVHDAAFARGRFYFACLDGGLVEWYPASDRAAIFFPGGGRGYDLPELDSADFPAVDTSRRVTGVEIVKDDSLLLVVTPARLWRFSLADASWDSSITDSFADGNIRFRSFDYVFINRLDRSLPLYAVVTAGMGDNGADSSILCKYTRASGRWRLMFDRAPKALSFGPDGYCYTLFDEQRPGSTLRNIIKVYRDTLGDSGVQKNPRTVIPDDRIHNRMTRSYDIDIPEEINDILYISRSDSSGYLWIATSEGLFFSRNETPGKTGQDTASFILIKRAPAIAAGLKKTYARPGILTPAVTDCKFIYNVSKASTNVTIKVYDFNMDLVKAIIENEIRQPGNQGGPLGRSTVESEDRWDGTNAQGRPVAPGVYYYKITTDKGERSFGKIVVAR